MHGTRLGVAEYDNKLTLQMLEEGCSFVHGAVEQQTGGCWSNKSEQGEAISIIVLDDRRLTNCIGTRMDELMSIPGFNDSTGGLLSVDVISGSDLETFNGGR